MIKTIAFFLFPMILITLCGCIGKVKWVEREGGDPSQKCIVPVCPHCGEVADYDTARCKNPKCRSLLAWADKVIYAENLYLEPPKKEEAKPKEAEGEKKKLKKDILEDEKKEGEDKTKPDAKEEEKEGEWDLEKEKW
jgi:hypothetical protein